MVISGDPGAPNLLIQPVDDHDEEGLEQELAVIRERTSVPFALAALRVRDWNSDLSPWEAPPVFGSQGFGAGAREELRFITQQLIPQLLGSRAADAGSPRLFLGGYSLAGLFALWAGYQTDAFAGIAAVSPSVWFPGWTDFAAGSRFLAGACYLSLGDREARTRNRVMAAVADNFTLQRELLEAQPDGPACILEWNPGNHFADPAGRTAKGFAWLLER